MRRLAIAIAILIAGSAIWLMLRNDGDSSDQVSPDSLTSPSVSKDSVAAPQALPGDRLLQDYGSPNTPPIEDLKKVHRVLAGYFSVVKDHRLYPIGGNEDLAASLRGENANKEAFISSGSPALNLSGQLIDRWSTPLFVHPEAEREMTIRSAGPDRVLFTEDDLILLPNGLTP